MVERSNHCLERCAASWVLSLVMVAGGLLVTGCRQPTPATPRAEPTATIWTPTDTPQSASDEEGQGDADVLHVQVVESEGGTWTFWVTVEHEDKGWEDYADGWDVVTPDGTVLKSDSEAPFTRLLLHPHVDEQPFTRSQSGIEIPAGVTTVRVRAHDLVDGYGGREVVADLTTSSGPGYEVVLRGD